MLDELKTVIPPSNVPPFRPEMAFPLLTQEMVERLRPYGREEFFPCGSSLFVRGERQTDMFVVVNGSVEIYAPEEDGGRKTVNILKRLEFSGELDLLNSQRSILGGRTASDSLLLRIPRSELQRLMRAEGDIANLIMQATIWRRLGILADGTGGIVLLGQSNDAESTLLQRFLIQNGYPHRVLESHADHDLFLGKDLSNTENILPCVMLSDGRVLHRPTITVLADELGITELPDPNTIYDVTVVGGGPAGLAAGVCAASEGLSTLVIEGTAPGGQAGTSSKIENYLGFPTGISGYTLAHRAQMQSLKFGVRFAISRPVVGIDQIEATHKLMLEGGLSVCSRSVVIATGARYRKLSLENYDRFENRGIYYAATAMESLLCREREVIVVGGGNSAGQAAVFLSGMLPQVHLIVRGESLASTMSQYLISRIENSSHITLYTESEIECLDGRSALESVTWINRRTGVQTTRPISSVFVMIGAEPNSGFLYGVVLLDKKGFIITGGTGAFENTPYATSVPGVYAVGDVRSNSVKRIASAVGEGSVVISDVYRYLADHRASAADPKSVLAAVQSVNASTLR